MAPPAEADVAAREEEGAVEEEVEDAVAVAVAEVSRAYTETKLRMRVIEPFKRWTSCRCCVLVPAQSISLQKAVQEEERHEQEWQQNTKRRMRQ